MISSIFKHYYVYVFVTNFFIVKSFNITKFSSFLRLKAAVESNKQREVFRLLSEGADPNMMEFVFNGIMDTGETVIQAQSILGIAVRRGSEAMVRQLLSAKADPKAAIDGSGQRPIHVAIDRGHIGLVKALINRGADYKIIWEGNNLLHYAISAHQVEIVEHLLFLGVDSKQKGKSDQDALEASRSASCRGCEIAIREATGGF